MQITSLNIKNKVQVLFDKTVHIQFYKRDFVAFQAYIHDNGYYTIEIHLKWIKLPVKCEYERREVWLKVITILDRL